jgi:leader peptidase (prepilin peptidase)/N-methyltransferase
MWPQPIAEIIGFMLGVAAMYLSSWENPATVPLCLGLGLLPAIALIDLHYGIIPDELNIALAISGLAWVLLGGGNIYITLMMVAALLGIGLFCALVYSRWRGKEMLGLGDVKFFAAAAFWLQPVMAAWFLGIAGLIGIISSLLWQRFGGGKQSPFAPALCLSLTGCVLWQVAVAGIDLPLPTILSP